VLKSKLNERGKTGIFRRLSRRACDKPFRFLARLIYLICVIVRNHANVVLRTE
jgi:hypothetical protein